MSNSGEITEEVRMSLTEAGIGPRLHDRGLASVPLYGEGLIAYLKAHGDAIRRDGWSVVFQGIGLTEAIQLFCRGLHINGIGCKITPLVRMRRVINEAEFRETVRDIDVLVLLNAQDTRRGNPLHDAVASEVEYLIRKRRDDKKATFLQFAVDPTEAAGELPNCYWSDEFLSFLGETFDHVKATDLMQCGTIA